MKERVLIRKNESCAAAKELFLKYKHAVPLIIYGILYLSWFSHLEKTVTGGYHVIHMAVDNYIPFCELFVVPYFLWFAYIATVVVYLLFKDKDDYYRACIFLFTGMTVFLIVSTVYPNGHHLRPAQMPRDNVFTHMVAALYRTDTSTNLFPSIHVYNSIGAHLAVINSRRLSGRKWVRRGSLVLCISIILSTMFIKQHSVFDVLTAFGLAAFMYVLVYRRDIVFGLRRLAGPAKNKPDAGTTI